MTKKLLLLGAHPDDMELEAGGTIAKLSSFGWDITSVVFTTGSYTNTDGKTYSSTSLQEEAKNAGKILGIKKIFFLSNSATFLNSDGNLVSQIDNIIHLESPDLVISLSSKDSHQDHRNVGLTILSCARQAKIRNLLVPQTLPYRPLLASQPINFYVDISRTLSIKLKAIKAYKSQYQKYGEDQLLKRVEAMAIMQGWAINTEYAEGFETIKMIDSFGEYL